MHFFKHFFFENNIFLFLKKKDAVENLGESEVREAHLAKAEYLLRIGDKVNFFLIKQTRIRSKKKKKTFFFKKRKKLKNNTE